MTGTGLADNLYRALARRGLTIKSAARHCGRHPDSLERVFLGATAKIDATMLDRLARAIAARAGDASERDRFICEIFGVAPHGGRSDAQPRP